MELAGTHETTLISSSIFLDLQYLKYYNQNDPFAYDLCRSVPISRALLARRQLDNARKAGPGPVIKSELKLAVIVPTVYLRTNYGNFHRRL